MVACELLVMSDRCWIFLDADGTLEFEGEYVTLSKGQALRVNGTSRVTMRTSPLQALEAGPGIIACLCRMQGDFEEVHPKPSDEPTVKPFRTVGPLLKGNGFLVEDMQNAEGAMHGYAIAAARQHLKELKPRDVTLCESWLYIKEQWVLRRCTDADLEQAMDDSRTAVAILKNDAIQAGDILSSQDAIIALTVAECVSRSLNREAYDTLHGVLWEYLRLRCKLRSRAMARQLVAKLPAEVCNDLTAHPEKSKTIGEALVERALEWLKAAAVEVNEEFEAYLLLNTFGREAVKK